jgi:hypothetical protein
VRKTSLIYRKSVELVANSWQLCLMQRGLVSAKYTLFLACLLGAVPAIAAPKAAPSKKLLYIDFYNQANDQNVKWIENSIITSLHEATRVRFKYEKIDEALWRKEAAKLKLSGPDFFSQDKIRDLGKALKANGVIYGQFTIDPRTGLLTIEGKILSVADNEIVGEEKGSSPVSAELFQVTDKVSVALGSHIEELFLPSNTGALWRSALLPGWGQYYKDRKRWGMIYSVTAGTLALATTVSLVLTLKNKSDLNSMDPGHTTTPQGETIFNDSSAAAQQFKDKEAQVNFWGTATKISLIGFGIVYLINLFDAFFISGDYSDVLVSSLQPEKAVQFALHMNNYFYGEQIYAPQIITRF